MESRTRYLINDLNQTHESFYKTNQNPQQTFRSSFLSSRSHKSPINSKTKLSKERDVARYKYQQLTNMTKKQQRQIVWKEINSNKKKKKQWNHTYYMGNNKLPHVQKTFSIIEKEILQNFPDNNTKYNVQFLNRSLYGTSMKFPRSQSGQFKKPQNHLYSRHYRPIVKEKIKFNQDWQLSTSLFGHTWVDHKRDRIMNKYQLQMTPFKTPKSNQLIAKMSKSQIYS